MTRTAKKNLAALTATFGGREFLFNFSAEYAHDAGVGAMVEIGRKVFQGLVDSGLVKRVSMVSYRLA